jgi:hypothetical protein
VRTTSKKLSRAPISTMPIGISVITHHFTPTANRGDNPTALRIATPITIETSIGSSSADSACSTYAPTASARARAKPQILEYFAAIR